MIVDWNGNGLSLLSPAQRSTWADDPAFDLADDGFSLIWTAHDRAFLVGEVRMVDASS